MMAWALVWPATKPTASSLDAPELAVPDAAEVPVLDAPAEESSGLVATPVKSRSSKLTVVADLTWTVTVVVGWAFAAYQSSPSE